MWISCSDSKLDSASLGFEPLDKIRRLKVWNCDWHLLHCAVIQLIKEIIGRLIDNDNDGSVHTFMNLGSDDLTHLDFVSFSWHCIKHSQASFTADKRS